MLGSACVKEGSLDVNKSRRLKRIAREVMNSLTQLKNDSDSCDYCTDPHIFIECACHVAILGLGISCCLYPKDKN